MAHIEQANSTAANDASRADRGKLFFPSVLTGMGLGGFIDGIVIHQLLQWHHMLCPTPDCTPTSLGNMMQLTFLDGLFHLLAWVLTLAGVLAIFRALRSGSGHWSGRVLAGGLLAGWGLFNLIEGLVDHYILQIHHVRPGPDQALWDLAFMILGAALLIGGWLLSRSAGKADPSSTPLR